jgi:hypothetical protein
MNLRILGLFSTVWLVTCSTDVPPAAVTATDTPVVWTLDTVPLVSIGRADDADPVYALHRVGDVLLLPDFRVAVASQRSVVQIFDTPAPSTTPSAETAPGRPSSGG